MKTTKKLTPGQKAIETIKTVVFFTVPAILIVCGVIMSTNSFNAF